MYSPNKYVYPYENKLHSSPYQNVNSVSYLFDNKQSDQNMSSPFRKESYSSYGFRTNLAQFNPNPNQNQPILSKIQTSSERLDKYILNSAPKYSPSSQTPQKCNNNENNFFVVIPRAYAFQENYQTNIIDLLSPMLTGNLKEVITNPENIELNNIISSYLNKYLSPEKDNFALFTLFQRSVEYLNLVLKNIDVKFKTHHIKYDNPELKYDSQQEGQQKKADIGEEINQPLQSLSKQVASQNWISSYDIKPFKVLEQDESPQILINGHSGQTPRDYSYHIDQKYFELDQSPIEIPQNEQTLESQDQNQSRITHLHQDTGLIGQIITEQYQIIIIVQSDQDLYVRQPEDQTNNLIQQFHNKARNLSDEINDLILQQKNLAQQNYSQQYLIKQKGK